eukprot:2008342-Amphidinium_carterae.1
MAEAVSGQHDCVITVGGQSDSNHCRATAAAAALLGLEVLYDTIGFTLLVSSGMRFLAANETFCWIGRLIMLAQGSDFLLSVGVMCGGVRLCGAKIHLCPASDYRQDLLLVNSHAVQGEGAGSRENFVPGVSRKAGISLLWTVSSSRCWWRLCAKLREQLRCAGKLPYIVPVGGTTPMSAWGYINAVQENSGVHDVVRSFKNSLQLCKACVAFATTVHDCGPASFDHVVFALGSGGGNVNWAGFN